MENHRPTVCTIRAPNPHIACITQSGRIFCHDIEDGLNIRRRAGDHAENLTRGSLLLQRFLELLEQPHVLDGDDGLVGEGFNQLDLPFGEGLNVVTPNGSARRSPRLPAGAGQRAMFAYPFAGLKRDADIGFAVGHRGYGPIYARKARAQRGSWTWRQRVGIAGWRSFPESRRSAPSR